MGTYVEAYRDYLDEIAGPVEIGNLSYDASQVLERVDPIAFRCGFNDWTDGLECQDCGASLDAEQEQEADFLCDECRRKHNGALSPAVFEIDGICQAAGWHSVDETWNGWACPFFDFNTAARLAEASDPPIRYNADADQFEEQDEQSGDWQAFAAAESKQCIDGEWRKLYPLGAYAWTWETAEDS